MNNKYLDYEGLRYLWAKIHNRIEGINYGFLNISISTNLGGG